MTAFKQALNRFRKQQQQSGDPQPDDWIDFRTNDERVIQLNDTTWTLRDFPGFLFVPGGVPHPEKLAKEALLEYCEPPHVTNLAKETTNCHWSHYRETGIWRPSWATCGYHYDWTARAYHRDRNSLLPEALTELGRTFGLERAEACIVNYYHSNSRMGGHVDDLEVTLEPPIVSLSVGRSALFVLGGLTPDEEPVVGVKVRSGDVYVLSGPSRLRVHGMACLLPQDEKEDVIECEDAFMTRFLKDHRININLRQVYPEG